MCAIHAMPVQPGSQSDALYHLTIVDAEVPERFHGNALQDIRGLIPCVNQLHHRPFVGLQLERLQECADPQLRLGLELQINWPAPILCCTCSCPRPLGILPWQARHNFLHPAEGGGGEGGSGDGGRGEG